MDEQNIIKLLKENDKCPQCNGVLKYAEWDVVRYADKDRTYDMDEPKLSCDKCYFECRTGGYTSE